MKKSLLLSSLCIAAVFVSQTAQAEIKIRAGVASSTYTLGGDYVDAESSYNPTNFGLTWAADNGMYIDVALSGGSGDHNGWAVANAPTTICVGEVSCGNAASPSAPFERSDAALIFGMSFLNPNSGIAGTIYTGLKTGTTTLGANKPVTNLLWTEETFEATGVVFGGGASFPIAAGKAGSIGVSLGLGVMQATWQDNTGFAIDADFAVGFSYGVSYTYPITSMFGVVADIKGNSYSYEFDYFGTPFTVDETVSSIGVSLYAKF